MATLNTAKAKPNGEARSGAKAAAAAVHDPGLPVGTLAHLPEVMRDFGFDPWELLESFDVTEAMMRDPLAPLPVATHCRIMQAACEQTGCAHLGLLVGQRARLENTGPLRFLVASSATPREAIEGLARYVRLWYAAIHFHLEYQGAGEDKFVALSIALDGYQPGQVDLLTTYMAATLKHLESICGRHWRPAQVTLARSKPEDAEIYTRFFRAPVLFDQPGNVIYFHNRQLDVPRPGADPQLHSFLSAQLGKQEAQQPPDFVDRVKQVIESLLESKECTMEHVASLFAIHRFTLYRYLQEAGVVFEDLLDEVRRDHAMDMLENTAMPIADIAGALGYSTASSFGRAFTRWFGQSPRSWRTVKLGMRRASSSTRKTRART